MTKELCYQTSRDMKRLKELLDEGFEVVCFVTYDIRGWFIQDKDDAPIMCTDVCAARLKEDGEYTRYEITSRGKSYFEHYVIEGESEYAVLEEMECCDIQFIEPTIKK